MFYRMMGGGMVTAAAAGAMVAGGGFAGTRAGDSFDIAAAPDKVFSTLLPDGNENGQDYVNGDKVGLKTDYSFPDRLSLHFTSNGKAIVDTNVTLAPAAPGHTTMTIEDVRHPENMTPDQRQRMLLYPTFVRMMMSKQLELLDKDGSKQIMVSAQKAAMPAAMAVMINPRAFVGAPPQGSATPLPSYTPTSSAGSVSFEPGKPMVDPNARVN
jgi:hypothetical protein